jgi:2-polyprenyl-3-methyl-5-hydroxy-6-metoxy-1,4-benzoquinol methylase
MTTLELATDPTDPAPASGQGTYVVPNDWVEAQRRLHLLEECFDPTTTRRLERTGIASGWHCAEVGGGGGSVARWLCERVGPGGRVLTLDIDTRFLEELDYPNLEVRRQNIVTQPLAPGEFDLVHARAVLMHLPAREAVLANLVAALRPGGWLVLEEADFFPILACASGLYREFFASLAAVLAPAGMASDWGRQLPGLLHSAGLQAVAADADVQFFAGGSAGAQFIAVSVAQLRDTMVAGGYPPEDLDRCLALLDDPSVWFPQMAIVGASGHRPA